MVLVWVEHGLEWFGRVWKLRVLRVWNGLGGIGGAGSGLLLGFW